MAPAVTRVLYVINDLALGGAQRVLLAQAAGLDRARFAPEVASLELIPGAPLAGEFEQADIPVHRLRSQREPAWVALPRLHACLRQRQPDLVHTHLAAAGVAGRVSARLTGVRRIVTTLHNLSDWRERRGHPLRRLERTTLPLAGSIVAVSDAVRDAFVSACPELASRSITIRNGVALDSFRRPPSGCSESRAPFGFEPGHFVVGAVARLDRRKGLDTLIEALARLAAVRPEVRLLIVGDGEERRRLFEQSRVLGVESRISWAGHRKDVRPALAAMDLFAAPSRSEGLGVAIIEALAAGVPVLGAAVGGIPELLAGAACARLLPSEEPKAWAEAIAELVGRGPALAQMADAAPAHAARFSNAASVAALEELYARALEGPLEAQRVAA